MVRTGRSKSIARRLAAAAMLALGAAPVLAQDGIATDPQTLDELRYARNLSSAFKNASRAVEPAVVHITSQRLVERVRRGPFGRRVRVGSPTLREAGLGSGVIIDASGIVLTNHHVVADADALIVRLADERELEAELVGSDPATDIAVLRIDGPDLVAAPLGDSDGVDVGEWVLAIGSPFGFDRTVTAGIISAKGRSGIGDDDGDRFQDFLQTDASINPGNSGGPLITLDGAVIGINTAIASRTGGSNGIGFAIPANMARDVADRLIESGRVERGWLGVGLADIDPALAREMGYPPEAAEGVAVSFVREGSPAERAGFERGDVILRWNGRPAENFNRLRNLIALTGPGETAAVQILRDGEYRSLSATLIDRAEVRAEARGGVFVRPLAAIATELDRSLARQIGLRRLVPGAVLLEVDDGGPADRAGLQAGDLIIEVDGRGVDAADDLVRLLDRARSPVRVELLRRGLRGAIELELR